MKLYVKDEQAGYRPATIDERINMARRVLYQQFRRRTTFLNVLTEACCNAT